MFKIDDNYSDYHTIDPVKYPGGAAINSSGVDTTDGTPWLAKMFNNCVGWMQALYIKAFGSLAGISNDAENAQTSDVVRALEKIQTDNNAAERAISEGAYFKKSGGTINGNVDVNGQLTAKDSTIDGALHVKGDLLVDGTGKEIISTELNVGADTIKLRKDNPTGLTPSELAGVITENYDGQGNNILAVDKDGNARVGDIDIATRLLYSNDGTNFFEDEALTITATIGQDEIVRDTGNTTSGGVKIYEGTTFSNDDTEAIATREDSPANGGFAKWNAVAKRFDAVVPDAAPTAGSQNLATSGGIFAAVAAASNNFILTAQGAADAQKTIDLPGGQISEGQTITVNFKNGHAMIYNNPLTLNNILVVSNQNGTLAPIPLHAMTEGGQTVYKVLGPNTILSLFYTADYDGNGTPAFVIVGNPLVLSASDYKIYADGQIGDDQVATVRARLSNNVPYGWIMGDDTVRHKEDYPKLWNEIPSAFKNTSNNTFVIDLRGMAIMGADASNPLGTRQESQNKSHSHAQQGTFNTGYMAPAPGYNSDNATGTAKLKSNNDCGFETQFAGASGNLSLSSVKTAYAIGSTSANNKQVYEFLNLNVQHIHSVTLGGNTGGDGGTEARPKNVRMNWIIKAM